MLEVHLSHLEHIATVRQEDIAAFTVLRHVLVLALLEGFEFFGIVASHSKIVSPCIASSNFLA